MLGILRCTRYAFGPNRLHYCGPDANSELKAYVDSGSQDPGLEALLKQFQTLYPYLKHIAKANHIEDPFDERVVEAYWLGNELLTTITMRNLHSFFIDDLGMKKKLGNKEFEWVEEKIGEGALPHHSFHVLNMWKQSGNTDFKHDINSFDECRISCGKVIKVFGPEITVSYEPLIYKEGKLSLGLPIEKKIIRRLEAEYDIEQIKPGQIVSMHWSVPCEVITEEQANNLKKFTLDNITFCNKTI